MAALYSISWLVNPAIGEKLDFPQFIGREEFDEVRGRKAGFNHAEQKNKEEIFQEKKRSCENSGLIYRRIAN